MAKYLTSNPRRLAAASVVGAAALALISTVVARRAERRHKPHGYFIEVDGVRLHYSDQGEGSPVVLIHGNAVTGDDWDTSGVAGRLLKTHRVIIFDRPGFGHSTRPHGRLWTAREQADLLMKALRQLRVERPVVVGHSWGTLVALEMGARHRPAIAGLVLISGYYFWTLRPDVLLVATAAMPVLGDILRYTLSPITGRLLMPVFKRAIFSPARVPERFNEEYSPVMALRPWQIRATAVDGVLMIPGAIDLRDYYNDLAMPVIIIAGAGDKIVFKQRSERLHKSVPGSVLQVIKGAGHMLHHLVPERVVDAVETIAGASPGSIERLDRVVEYEAA